MTVDLPLQFSKMLEKESKENDRLRAQLEVAVEAIQEWCECHNELPGNECGFCYALAKIKALEESDD